MGLTREEAIKLHKEKIWRNSIGDDKWKIEDFVNVIFDEHEAELKAKDERIAELKEGAKNTAEIYAKQLAAKDKKITELEVKLDRFCGLKKRGKK